MNSLTVQEFMNKNPKKGRNSKLEPYKDDIFLLKNSGYSQPQILNFLQQNGVEVGLTTLKSFIKNRTSESEPVSRHKTVQATNTTPTNTIERTEPIAHQKEEAAIPAQKKRPSQAQPPKPTQVEPAVKNDVPPAKPTAPQPTSTENDRHPINTGFKKFNSREQRDIDDLI